MIAQGQTQACDIMSVVDDSLLECDEDVIFTIQPAAAGTTPYTIGNPSTHTLTITDNDGLFYRVYIFSIKNMEFSPFYFISENYVFCFLKFDFIQED